MGLMYNDDYMWLLFYMQSSKNRHILFGNQTEMSMKNKDT